MIRIKFINTVLLLLASMSACTAQNSNDMQKIPLKEGRENPITRMGDLEIKTEYVIKGSEPRHPDLELRVHLREGDKTYTTSLVYYETDDENTNDYPLAFQGHLISVEPNDDSSEVLANLIIEKNELGREFFIQYGQEAILGNLRIRVSDVVHETAQFSPDGPEVSGAIYYLVLSEGANKKKIEFTSYEMDEKGSLTFEWNQFMVSILHLSGDFLKMKVEKNGCSDEVI